MHKTYRSLGVIFSEISSDSVFRIGILIKFLLLILLIPLIQKEWFVPFITNWIENPLSLPWAQHVASGGDLVAYPYGVVMFIFHLPMTFLGWLIDNIFELEYFTSIGFGFSLFIADVLLLVLLIQTFEKYQQKILLYYWLSPLVIFITYWHGQVDLIPVALFFYGLALIKRQDFIPAAIFLAFSIAAKHSMIIGMPFVILYLWSHNGIYKEFQRFLMIFVGTLLIFQAPFLLSESFRAMVIENREAGKIYTLFIDMSNGVLIYLTPLVYLLLLYFFWRIRRINFELLIAAMGVAFSIIILMTPSTPGWYLWLAPIFAIHQSRYGFGAVTLVGVFSLLFISFHVLQNSGSDFLFYNFGLFDLPNFYNSQVKSLHYTLTLAFGLLIAIQILRHGVRENDYYQLGNKPLLLGIGGDSGVGKSTFSKSLATIFGERSLVEVSGDDYHIWDRASPMWETVTHLDPKANRLFELVKDVRSLMFGNVVYARRYDHVSGHFLPKKITKSRDFIIVEGLHALYPKQLLESFDVRFFIDMDESLKNSLRLKRDVEQRGHAKEKVLSEIERRRFDSSKYIMPQSKRADVVFKMLLINSDLSDQIESLFSNVKLKISMRNGIYYQELVRVLIGVCALQVNIDSLDENGAVVLEISGDVASDDIALAMSILLPNMEELLDFSAKFENGIGGIMQLITLMEVDEALKRRRLL